MLSCIVFCVRLLSRIESVLICLQMFVYTLGMVIYAGVQFGNRSVAVSE